MVLRFDQEILTYYTGSIFENGAPPLGADDLYGTFKNQVVTISVEEEYGGAYGRSALFGEAQDQDDRFHRYIYMDFTRLKPEGLYYQFSYGRQGQFMSQTLASFTYAELAY